jgi:predicted TPR repeat methyltransferase
MAAARADEDLVTPAEAVKAALQWHREGRLAEARILYERVLAVEPDNADALHFLGLLRHQLGAPEEGADYVRKAVQAAPDYAAAHSNLGNMLLEKGDLDGAEQAYRRALELMPNLVDAKNNLGLVLKRLDRLEEAERTYREAIAQAPEHPSAYNNLGHLLAETGRLDEAVAFLEQAVSLNPKFKEAFHNLGNALSARHRPEEAAAAYRRAVELGADAYLGLATALREQGLVVEAIAAYRKVIAIDAYQPRAYYALGMLLSAKRRTAEAIEVYQQWLKYDPDNPVARHMLAACRQESVPPRAADAYVRAMFDGFAPDFDRRLRALEYRAPELTAELLEQEFGDAAAKLRILDAGCGTGLCGPLLRPYAAHLTGVDLSAGMLELAHARGDYDELVRSELTAFLDDAKGDFDIIVSADTLVYFGDLEALMCAASRALTPGGRLIATLERTEDANEPEYRLNSNGRFSHSERYLKSVCRDCGLRLRSIKTQVLRKEMGQPVMGLVFCASPDADLLEKACTGQLRT